MSKLPPTLWRDDGEPFDLNPQGLYVMRNSEMIPPYAHSPATLINAGVFKTHPPRADSWIEQAAKDIQEAQHNSLLSGHSIGWITIEDIIRKHAP